MNRLQHETSPYLLQHANNPVNWFAWKPEAFEKAKKEDKPILVSIGYSTCHWCHVMEKESFEDKEVAEFMNDHFVCIKVDREERPDVDQIYMEACQILTGSGGWPLNCFLTPDKKPFHAGTYYPPMPRHNRPSWLQVLMNLSHAFQNKREVISEQANRLLELIQKGGPNKIRNHLSVVSQNPVFSSQLLHSIHEKFKSRVDRVHGGFGSAPKFPGTMGLHYLLDYQYYYGDEEALRLVELSLDKMIMGGIYDQLGGGFARYSTDSQWLVPHFEKMLYDNALLVSLLSEVYKKTKKQLYRETIEETLNWVKIEMTGADHGFYSALDADSEGEEGKFYVWSKEEIAAILGDKAQQFCEFYDVSEAGNWEGKNILRRKTTFQEFAESRALEPGDFQKQMAEARGKLMEARNKRIPPGLDDKVLLDWNALMCSSYAKAYSATGTPEYKEVVLANLNFIFANLLQDDGISLYHTYKSGKPQYDAFFDDYSYLIEAFLDVYEITFDTHWLLQAERYTQFVLEHFFDEQDKLFYFTSSKQNDIPVRRKDLYDAATPSGNSTMVRNLQRLAIILDKEEYRNIVEGMLAGMQHNVEKYPASFGRWATTCLSEANGILEIAIVGEMAKLRAKEINEAFIPQKVLMASENGDSPYPLLKGRKQIGSTFIYLCKNFTCHQPVQTLEDFLKLLKSNIELGN